MNRCFFFFFGGGGGRLRYLYMCMYVFLCILLDPAPSHSKWANVSFIFCEGLSLNLNCRLAQGNIFEILF